MALTVREVINHARDQHPALSPVNAPNELAFRFLSRLECELFDQIYKRVPGFLAQQAVVTLPLADFEAGINLTTLIPQGWKDLTDVFFKYTAVPTTPNEIRGVFKPWEQRDVRGQLPAYTFRGNALFLIGNATDYVQFSQLTLTYTQQNPDVTSLDSTFLVTDDARETLAMGLASFWLRRLIDDPIYRVSVGAYREVKSLADEEKKDFLTRIFTLTQRQDYKVRAIR